MAFSRIPGLADQSFWDRVPNIFPAGDAPWAKDQPSVTAEPASAGLIPNRIQVWLNPGMYMEPPSGYGPEGRSSALFNLPQFPFFGFPGFGIPPFPGFFGLGPPPPPPPPDQTTNPAGETDYLSKAIQSGTQILKSLSGAGNPVTPSFPGLDNAMQDVWGFSPKDNPNFSVMGPEEPGVQYPTTNLGVDPTIQAFPPGGDIGINPAILGSSPLFGAEAGPAMGFGAEPTFGLSGEVTNAGQLANPSLGFNPTLSTTAATAPTFGTNLISGPTAGIAGGVLAGMPLVGKAIGGQAGQDITNVFSSPGVQMTGAMLLAALSSNPIGWAAASTIPLVMAGLHQFDVGGKARRTARDYESLQSVPNSIQRILSALQLYDVNPEVAQLILSQEGWHPEFLAARLAEIRRNNRVNPEILARVEQMARDANPRMTEINNALSENNIAQARRMASATPLSPQQHLTEAEAWRLAEVARLFQETEAQRQANIALRAAGMGEGGGGDGGGMAGGGDGGGGGGGGF